ncbi:maestro heat-like repeat-containing protein family member 7 [Phaenicophaeus curvirostris]|uniref:maestro heat-like repeat-containing protein family member 7 n=1 Tax=Phaenicophaeus curvirostris TaxID=33595 RepID=UPI0037F0F763
MLGLLPDLMGVMNDSNSDIALNALQVILSVMGHLKKEEASPFAVQLTEQLLPVFNHESSNVRETSITLFRDQLKNVVRRNKQQMKKNVQMALLPLFLHVNDETERVAKASAEALLAAAEFLRWAQLKHLVQMQQTWSIAECLLAQRRSKTEDYLDQSVPYLKDAQKDLRLAAVRFIGRAVQHLKDQSPGKMEMICFALEPLREDSDIAVRSLATQTILIMNRPRQQTRARRILQALRF